MTTTELLVVAVVIVAIMGEACGQEYLLNMTSPMPDFIRMEASLNDTAIANNSKTLITILTTITYESDIYPLGPLSTEAVRFALEKLNSLPNWLPNYELAFELIDDNADNAQATEQLALRLETNDEAENRFPLAMLTDCGDFAQWITAAMSQQYNFVSFSLAVNIYRLYSHRYKFPNYYGHLERPDIYYVALIEFMKSLSWGNVAIISEIDLYTDMMDSYLVKLLDQNNFTLLYMAKVAYESEDEEEMTANFDLLKSRNARIIISQALSNVNMACWLHRYGMYGPSYVIFSLAWNSIDETAEIPEYLPWCTTEMVLEVLPSMIPFGDATLEDVLGPEATDVVGATASQLTEYLTSRIVDAEATSSLTTFWAPYFYDRALYTGMLLNVTETLLNARNETLSDWFTNSPKFQSNGQEIVQVLKEAVRSLDMRGIKGDYSFDSKDHSTGYVPIGFTQISVTNESTTTQQTISYYKANQRKILYTVDHVDWRTIDGLPPKDLLTFLPVKRPAFPTEGVQYAFIAIAALLIAVSIALAFCLFLMRGLRKGLPGHLLPILLGDIIILSHIFVIPVLESSETLPCSSIVTLIIVGYSLMNAAIAEELHKTSSQVPTHTAQLGYRQPSAISIVRFYNRYQSFVNSKRALFCLLWPSLQLTLFAVAFGSGHPLITAEAKNLTVEMSQTDASLVYQPYRYECSVSASAFEGNILACVLLCISGVSQVYLLVRVSYLSYFLHSNRKRVNLPLHLNRASKYIYCQILIMIGGFFVGAMGLTNGQYLLVTTSCVVVLLVVLSLSLIVLPQFKVTEVAIEDNPAMDRENYVSVHKPGRHTMTVMNAQYNQAQIGQQTVFVLPAKRTTYA